MTSAFGKGGVKGVLRAIVPLIVLSGCIWLLSRQVSADVFRDLPAHLAATPLWAWGIAIAFTALSFFSLGRYDGIAHRHLKTGVPRHQAHVSGMASIAIAQTLGFGLLTGAAARWRILPALNLPRALAVSAFVSVSFVVCWVLVTALFCLIFPAPAWTKLPAAITLLAAPLLTLVLFCWPVLHWRRLALRAPTLRAGYALVFWTALDTAAAAVVLWTLLPAGAEIALTAFIPVFLLATGLALISNTPGGVGPFELALVSLLPGLSADTIVQSIIAYRLVYYALPACVGLLFLLRPLSTQPLPNAEDPAPRLLYEAARSETAVITQNGGYLAPTQDGAVALWPTGQTVTALFGPIGGTIGACLDAIQDSARAQDRWPLLYKGAKRDAAKVRKRRLVRSSHR